MPPKKTPQNPFLSFNGSPAPQKPIVNPQFMGFSLPIPDLSPQAGFEFHGGGSPAAPNPWSMLMQPQAQNSGIDFNALFTAMRHNPQGDHNVGYIPGVNNEHSPFANGFFQNGAAQMSPEAQMATQGRSATNQWAQLGQVPGVDPTKLQNVMGQMTPLPQQAQPEASTVSDPYFHLNLLRALGYASPARRM